MLYFTEQTEMLTERANASKRPKATVHTCSDEDPPDNDTSFSSAFDCIETTIRSTNDSSMSSHVLFSTLTVKFLTDINYCLPLLINTTYAGACGLARQNVSAIDAARRVLWVNEI